METVGLHSSPEPRGQQDHSHAPNNDDAIRRKAVTDMKGRAKAETTPIPDIYDQVAVALHEQQPNYYIIIIIYSYLSRDIPTDLSVFLQGALTKYLIECVEHEVMWHCEYQEEQSST